jgi:competence ComEA-like helix-hairpin-helix protein
LFFAVSAGAQQPAAGPPLVFQRLCGACHKPDTGVAMRRTTEQWQETVEKMISKGLKASDEDLNAVLDYLIAQYGKVDVNRAPAAEIAEVLGVTAKDAARIVKHRRDHGKFEDFEALANVPEIDRKRLEQLRDAIAF